MSPAAVGDLADGVARAGAELVQPPGERRALVPVVLPLRAEAGLELGVGVGVAVVCDAAGSRWVVPWCSRGGELRRAAAGDGAAEALLAVMTRVGPGRHDLGSGFVLESFVDGQGVAADPLTGERAITADQTNQSVVVGERAMVKWCLAQGRAGEPAPPSPVPGRLALLAAAGFRGTPRPWGILRWGGPDGLAAEVADHLPGAVDGWEWAVSDVAALATGTSSPEAALAPVAELGRLVAGMHAALAGGGVHRAEPAAPQGWAQRAQAELAEAGRILGPASLAVLEPRAGILSASYGVLAAAAGTPVIPLHGDLHVGQVLRHGSRPDYAVIDFEGNPVLAPADRLAPGPTALDVAGMLASLDHVGRIVLRRAEGADPAAVRAWLAAAAGVFLDSYREAAAGAGIGQLLDERLIAPLRYAQEVREYLYAVRHLPHWTYVADGALTDLIPNP